MPVVDVVVATRCPKFSIQVKDGIIKIRLTSPPEKGEANAELEKKLSKALGGAAVSILSGHTSKRKRLAIDIDEMAWKGFLERSGKASGE